MPIRTPVALKPHLNEEETVLLKSQCHTWPIPQKAKVFAQGGTRLLAVLRRCPRRMWTFAVKRDNWTIG